jgi:phosphate transport system substrate-binding protein
MAIDALTVVINPDNDWVTCLTLEQLGAIWAPGSTVTSWQQVDPAFPDVPLRLFGPGTDSGTFDYFTKEVNGEEGAEPDGPSLRPRTTTSSSKGSPEARAGWATSATPTSRRTPSD